MANFLEKLVYGYKFVEKYQKYRIYFVGEGEYEVKRFSEFVGTIYILSRLKLKEDTNKIPLDVVCCLEQKAFDHWRKDNNL
jgi:hypothetical protein